VVFEASPAAAAVVLSVRLHHSFTCTGPGSRLLPLGGSRRSAMRCGSRSAVVALCSFCTCQQQSGKQQQNTATWSGTSTSPLGTVFAHLSTGDSSHCCQRTLNSKPIT
jgi:hypothetical protein